MAQRMPHPQDRRHSLLAGDMGWVCATSGSVVTWVGLAASAARGKSGSDQKREAIQRAGVKSWLLLVGSLFRRNNEIQTERRG
jgi:hypothetical protein